MPAALSIFHPRLSGDFGRKSALWFSLIIWLVLLPNLFHIRISFIQKHLLSAFYVWSPVLGTGKEGIAKGKILAVSKRLCTMAFYTFSASIIIKEKKSRWPGSAFLEYICEKILSISFSMRGLSVNLHLQLNGDCSIESLFLIFLTFHLSSTRRMATSSYSRHPRWPLNRCEQSSLTGQTRPWSVKSRNRTWTVSLETNASFVASGMTWEWPCCAPVPAPGIPVQLWCHPRPGR